MATPHQAPPHLTSPLNFARETWQTIKTQTQPFLFTECRKQGARRRDATTHTGSHTWGRGAPPSMQGLPALTRALKKSTHTHEEP
jgi:hypothetical protein